MKTNIFFKSLGNKVVQCKACSHRCKISVGHFGVCKIRQNIDGKLKLLVDGKVVVANVDPIEKKPFYHFLPGSLAFSIGTFGCNFRCSNCQNYDISQVFYLNKIINSGEKLTPKEIIKAAKACGCLSIAYTYNEPTIWIEYALEIMKLAKKEGLYNVWVSNGFMTEVSIDKITPFLDAINIDIKSFDSKFYHQNCSANLEPVLNSCRSFIKKKIHLEITTLIIPTLSDDEEMLKNLAKFIYKDLGPNTPWHISAFSSEISWKLKNFPNTSSQKLEKIYQLGRTIGLNYVYVGNIILENRENTYCPKCGALVIKRIGYAIENNLVKGCCPNCKYKILGLD